ncbi:MAG TPA: hypothetical protein VFV52_11785 [Bacilli bacterium]|nr:hypothetical protein [Bacilli bacterium]
MEDRWFLLIRDTVGIAGNLAEVIGVVFLFSQLRRRARTSTRILKERPTPNATAARQ